MPKNIVVLDAPSNLGLRPPAPGTVPGCYKLAGALREQGVVRRLGAQEGSTSGLSAEESAVRIGDEEDFGDDELT